MTKRIIDLSVLENDFLGLIILEPTGVRYTNQMGGTACGHPWVEGLYIPLIQRSEGPDWLRDRRENLWVRYDTKAVQACLKEMELDDILAPVHFEEQSAAAFLDCVEPASRVWGEAWVPVKVLPVMEDEYPFNTTLVKDFAHHYGILTYNNSD